ncbi:hypothetical protein K438DRAFT_1785673 [Mycena galopus ATCC 62051]|nr:hypothetical protein K438DRAFT_1785673 [Mycena galopus ATCC 62051]
MSKGSGLWYGVARTNSGDGGRRFLNAPVHYATNFGCAKRVDVRQKSPGIGGGDQFVICLCRDQTVGHQARRFEWKPIFFAASSSYVSVEIKPWDTKQATDPALDDSVPVLVSRTDSGDEASDIDARLGWEWKRSGSNVTALDAELLELKEELKAARDDVKTNLSPEATEHVRKLERDAVDLEAKLKQAKAEAKSSSSGRVRTPRARTNPVVPTPTAQEAAADETSTVASVTAPSKLHLAAPEASASVASSEQPPSSSGIDGRSEVEPRRISSRKRPQKAEPSGASSKRQKRVEDPLAGWMMKDPETREQLTGHDWVARYPEELALRYKKDHKRYLEYLEYTAQDDL